MARTMTSMALCLENFSLVFLVRGRIMSGRFSVQNSVMAGILQWLVWTEN